MATGKNSDYTDTMGRFRTKSLFVETIEKPMVGIWEPVYSLKGAAGYPDLHDLYIEMNDPTEYAFAMAAFDSWKHFKHLESLKWFRAFLTDWRLELEVKIRSEAIRSMAITANTEGSKGVSAAKWLADKGWDKKRGRPSGEEVTRETKVQANIQADISNDAKRLGLH